MVRPPVQGLTLGAGGLGGTSTGTGLTLGGGLGGGTTATTKSGFGLGGGLSLGGTTTSAAGTGLTLGGKKQTTSKVLLSVHTERKRKFSLMFEIFSLISFACSLNFSAFAWCEWAPNVEIFLGLIVNFSFKNRKWLKIEIQYICKVFQIVLQVGLGLGGGLGAAATTTTASRGLGGVDPKTTTTTTGTSGTNGKPGYVPVKR